MSRLSSPLLSIAFVFGSACGGGGSTNVGSGPDSGGNDSIVSDVIDTGANEALADVGESDGVAPCTSGSGWTVLTVDDEAPRGSVGGQITAIAADDFGGAHLSYVQYPPTSANGILRYAYLAPGASAFITETVDDPTAVIPPTSTAESGPDSSIVVDRLGTIHIAYTYLLSQGSTITNIDLRYATRTAGGTWSTATIDDKGRAGGWPWIALDGAGGVNVTYYEEATFDLKYAFLPKAGSWTTSTIDPGGNVGAHSFLIADSSGDLHVSYTSPLEYMHRASGGSWDEPVVVDGTAKGNVLDTSLGVDSKGGLHLAYSAVNDLAAGTYELRYATKPAGGAWSWEKVPSKGNVATISLVVDRTDVVHLVYLDEADFRLYYVHRASEGSWSEPEMVDGTGGKDWAGLDNSLAVDESLRLHAAYLHPSDQTIRYATRCTR